MQSNGLTARVRFSARFWLLCVLCASVVHFLFAAPLRAATPRDELLRLVPDPVGFCVVVQDLRGHAASLQASPFFEQLKRSPLADKIHKSEELKKLDRIESRMKEKLGLDWARLRDDLLGDAIVFAYRPGPPGKPEQEQGVILIRARNPKILADTIERINKVQKEDGELKELEERRHNGAVYYRRLEYDKRAERDKPPGFYYVHGPILAFSGQESMLRQTIDCDRMRSADAVPEVTQRLRELDADRALLAVWLNPRAFDDEVESKTDGAPAERVATVKHFASYWKALESVVVSLAPAERDINLSLGLRAHVEELPPAARKLFREGAAPSAVWRRFPQEALLAVGGRFDGAMLLDVLGGFMTPKGRQLLHTDLNRQLGTLLGTEDFAKDVLPGLGPDWGVCVTAPAPRADSWLPQTLFALRVDPDRARKSLQRDLFDALDFAARLAIFAHAGQQRDRPMILKKTNVDKQEVHYLTSERGLPPGVRPAYGLLNGYLVLASSLESLTRFAQAPPDSAPSTDAPVPLLRISFKAWRAYLQERRQPIVQFLVDQNKLSREAADKQVDGLLAALQFVDRLELRQRSGSGQVIFTLSVQTAQALRK
ncbi:MAG TPA: hypothetical protein VH643_37560 [Gemmataceae bacterium]|jgi:hypothetical protein